MVTMTGALLLLLLLMLLLVVAVLIRQLSSRVGWTVLNGVLGNAEVRWPMSGVIVIVVVEVVVAAAALRVMPGAKWDAMTRTPKKRVSMLSHWTY